MRHPVLDLLLAALLIYALVRSVRHRSRIGALGAAVAGLALGALGLLSAAGWYGRQAEETGRVAWAVLMFLVGPGVVPGPCAVPLSAFFAAHPVLCRTMICGACGVTCVAMFYLADRHPHESDEADSIRGVALTLLLPAVVAALLPLFALLGSQLSGFLRGRGALCAQRRGA